MPFTPGAEECPCFLPASRGRVDETHAPRLHRQQGVVAGVGGRTLERRLPWRGWLGTEESNPHIQIQNLLSYH